MRYLFADARMELRRIAAEVRETMVRVEAVVCAGEIRPVAAHRDGAEPAVSPAGHILVPGHAVQVDLGERTHCLQPLHVRLELRGAFARRPVVGIERARHLLEPPVPVECDLEPRVMLEALHRRDDCLRKPAVPHPKPYVAQPRLVARPRRGVARRRLRPFAVVRRCLEPVAAIGADCRRIR